jgi:hypothetical protein
VHAPSRLRDRMGKHDGVMHGGRWLRSTVAIRTNQEIVHCPNKGKCSIDEVSGAPHATACSFTALCTHESRHRLN